ncbi:MAG: SpoIIE family protein phosphatase [Pirellulales bacterium]|nr:SpoIIE family protein phosphatase [Pirellulales bacterium]
MSPRGSELGSIRTLAPADLLVAAAGMFAGNITPHIAMLRLGSGYWQRSCIGAGSEVKQHPSASLQNVAKARPSYLRLMADEPAPEGFAFSAGQQDAMAQVADAVERLTGHRLTVQPPDHEPSRAGDGYPILGIAGQLRGYLTVDCEGRAGNRSARTSAQLTQAIAGLLTETCRAQDALWRREAELATGVPVSIARENEAHLAERLEGILRCGVDAIGMNSAALYLLDVDTTYLKLRACYGMSRSKLTESPRPLSGSLADLEALLGHAVVLTEPGQLMQWSCPEPCASAVCLPISGPSMPLGTVWFFSDQKRDPSSRETELLEIIAGRLACELERDAILAETAALADQRQGIQRAQQAVERNLPNIAPQLAGWDVAGATLISGEPPITFHDWCSCGDGRLMLASGSAICNETAPDLGSAIYAVTLRALIRTLATDGACAGVIATRGNRLFSELSPGDRNATLVLASFEQHSGELRIASAGEPLVMTISPGREWRNLSRVSPPIGSDLETSFLAESLSLAAGQVLIVVAGTQGSIAGECLGRLVESMSDCSNSSSAKLTSRLEQALRQCGQERASILVAQRSV